MKKRLPTAEEKKLWRESNRFTTVKQGVNEDDSAQESEEHAVPARSVSLSRSLSTSTQESSHPVSSQPLNALSTREASKRFKVHSEVEGTLDLHGMTKLEAHEKLQQFLRRAAKAGKRHVVIITGKGRGGEVGVLRKNLPDWLNEPGLRPLISGFAEAKPEKGGAGVTHVLLKRQR